MLPQDKFFIFTFFSLHGTSPLGPSLGPDYKLHYHRELLTF